MRGNRSRDTKPEISIRKLIHAAGLRYRINIRPVPEINRTADIVFTRTKIAVFIDGCFWHGCPEHYVPSKTNANYWNAKISGNKIRDVETSAALRDAGWAVIRFWSHEHPEAVAQQIIDAVA